MKGYSDDERRAWERWSPLVKIVDEIDAWSSREKQALVAIIRAKGDHPERDYVRRFDRHHALRAAVGAPRIPS